MGLRLLRQPHEEEPPARCGGAQLKGDALRLVVELAWGRCEARRRFDTQRSPRRFSGGGPLMRSSLAENSGTETAGLRRLNLTVWGLSVAFCDLGGGCCFACLSGRFHPGFSIHPMI